MKRRGQKVDISNEKEFVAVFFQKSSALQQEFQLVELTTLRETYVEKLKTIIDEVKEERRVCDNECIYETFVLLNYVRNCTLNVVDGIEKWMQGFTKIITPHLLQCDYIAQRLIKHIDFVNATSLRRIFNFQINRGNFLILPLPNPRTITPNRVDAKLAQAILDFAKPPEENIVKCYQFLLNILPVKIFRKILPLKTWLLDPWIPKFEVVEIPSSVLLNSNARIASNHNINNKITIPPSPQSKSQTKPSTSKDECLTKETTPIGQNTNINDRNKLKGKLQNISGIKNSDSLLHSQNEIKLEDKSVGNNNNNNTLQDRQHRDAIIANTAGTGIDAMDGIQLPQIPNTSVPASASASMSPKQESSNNHNSELIIKTSSEHPGVENTVALALGSNDSRIKIPLSPVTKSLRNLRKFLPAITMSLKQVDNTSSPTVASSVENPFFVASGGGQTIPFASRGADKVVKLLSIEEKAAKMSISTSQVRDWYVGTTGT